MSSFIDDKNFLNNLIAFLKEHEYLFAFPNKDLFTKDMCEIFLQKWPCLAEITEDELLKLPYDRKLQEKCDQKLVKFFEKVFTFSMLKASPEYSAESLIDLEIPKTLFVKMKKKKEYEIRLLIPIFLEKCKNVGIKTVIDIGCGNGNLIRILENFGMKCIGIEANKEFCRIAKQQNPNSIIINDFVTNESKEKIENLLNIHGPSAIISLHGCGNLQKVLLQIKVSIDDSRKLPLLFTLGCCYHKRTNNGESNEWAMSETIKSKLNEASLILNSCALRLGCDRGILGWSQQPNEQFEAHKNAVFNRAIIETVFPESASTKSQKRSTNRNLIGDLIPAICEKHSVPSEERATKESELKESFEKYSNFKDLIQPFSMFQSAIQYPMETLILLDSAYFLKENKHNVRFQALFDVLKSPRNMCLISSNFVC